MKKCKQVLSIFLAVIMLVAAVPVMQVGATSNEETIYYYLKNTLGFNTAAACGVLGNIYVESGFSPTAYNSSENAWGLCQWEGGRLTNLKSRYPSSWQNLDSQLGFLKWELEGGDYYGQETVNYLKSVSNSADGASKAAKFFAQYFERCASSTYSTRMNRAANTYWPKYKDSNPDTLYNVSAAVDYANAHWDDGQGLCAEFVARCLDAGGISIPNRSCYDRTEPSYLNNSGVLGDYTNPFIASPAQLHWFADQGYEIITNPSDSEFSLGDVAFMPNTNGSRDGHVGIITKVENGHPYYSAHNNARDRARLYNCTYLVKMNGSPYADLGEQFYALILNTKYWKPISLNTDTNKITLETEKNVPYQKWRFTRQDDKAYVIESCENGKALEMTNGVCEAKTQLTAHDYWWGEGHSDTDARYQQWYLIPQGDGYVFQSKHCVGDNWVMDLRGSSNADGSVIQIYQRNDNYADDETWSVYKIDDYSNSSNVKTDKSIYPLGADVKLSWNYCVGATSYSLAIWKAGEWRNGVWKDAYPIDTIRIDKATTSYTYRPTEDGGYTFMLKAVDAEEVSSVSRIIVNPQAIDLGEDFFAEIVNTSTRRIIGNFDNNVQASSNEENDPRLIWHFLQNGDGSYNVYNTYNGALLTAENGGTTSGDNIICQSNHVGASQHWVITHRNGVDCLVSSSGNRFMSLEGGSPEPGTNVKLWTDNGTGGAAAQGFSVVKKTDYARPEAPDASELSISSLGSQDTDTVFTWTASPLKSAKYDNRAYNLRIWQGSELGVNGTEYAQAFNLTDTTCSVRLPKGQYTAYLTAQNTKYHWFSTPSNSVTFTIGNHTHDWTLNTTEAATCIATGTKTFTCSCGASYTETISIDSSNHVNTTNIAATASTCSVRGYSAGVYCNDCKRFISGHEAQSLAPNNHVNTTNVAATRSTCTERGYSAGVYCNDCKQYISGHEAQPLAAHQTTTINDRAATCTQMGYTGDQYCTVCKQTISYGTTIPLKNHTLVTKNAREATYDAEGYTGDQYCTSCNQIIAYGTAIPKLTRPNEPTNPTQPATQPTTQQQQQSGNCKYCGGTHTGFPGILIGFFHSILALFGLRK